MPGPPVIVPGELELSPQEMVAEKSLRVPVELWSVNIAVGPVYVCVLTGIVAHIDESRASLTLAVEVTVALFLGLSTSVIVTVVNLLNPFSNPRTIRVGAKFLKSGIENLG